MLRLDNLTFRYESGPPVLDHVDLAIEDGELLLLAGPTGVGKSTLLGVVAGLVPSYTGGTLSGDVLLEGRSIIDVPARDRAHAIGYVGQNPPSWFVTDTVEEELAFGMEQLGLAPATMRRRVEETLDLLGIADLRARDLRTLSGGQQQRVAIGSVLTTHPRLLVLDEPTSALDPTAAEDVLATLTRLVHDTGISVLVAEHRLERVVPFADRICLLGADPAHPGRVVVGDPAEVLAHGPIAPPIVELGRLAGWSPLPLSVRDARRHAGDLRARLGSAGAAVPDDNVGDLPESQRFRQVRRPDGAGHEDHQPLVEARGLAVLHGRTPALRHVDLALQAGTVTALMGRNGAGKSTLMWTLQGRHTPAQGTTRVDGKPGLVPQSPADLLYLETVAEECAEADRSARAADGTCRALLDRLAPGIPGDQHPRDLSEGQRLALAVAIVLTPKPRVLLLDEPTRGLDYPAKHQLAEVLKELATEAGAERAILVATHDVEFVAQAADRMVVLAEGEVVSAGPVGAVITESPAFAPQVTKVLGPGWLSVADVETALAGVQ